MPNPPSEVNTPKALATLGTPLATDSLTMYVEVVGVQFPLSCQREIEKTLLNTLSKCGFFRADVTYTMPDDHTRLTIIATSYEQKTTPEKNGAT
jgi:hypothetical protein